MRRLLFALAVMALVGAGMVAFVRFAVRDAKRRGYTASAPLWLLLLAIAACYPMPLTGPPRPAPACTVKPEVVSFPSFCARFYGASPCVLCFASVDVFHQGPQIAGCVTEGNQYCVDASGCDDPLCR